MTELKHPKEIEIICAVIEDRVVELCRAFGNREADETTFPRFWSSVRDDLDKALTKTFDSIKKEERLRIMEKIRNYENKR